MIEHQFDQAAPFDEDDSFFDALDERGRVLGEVSSCRDEPRFDRSVCARSQTRNPEQILDGQFGPLCKHLASRGMIL